MIASTDVPNLRNQNSRCTTKNKARHRGVSPQLFLAPQGMFVSDLASFNRFTYI